MISKDLVRRLTAAKAEAAKTGATWESVAKAKAAKRFAKPYAPCGSPDSKGRRFVELTRCGLRFVGRVEPDGSFWRGNKWARGETGYYCDDMGAGFGLAFGLVAQLPGRKGVSRFIAGFGFSESSDESEQGVFDLADILEESTHSDYVSPRDNDAAISAASTADSMAEHAAEQERDYQRAWRIGSDARDARDLLLSLRSDFYALNAERREARKGSAAFPVICKTIEGKLRDLAEAIQEARATMESCMEGRGENFWNDRDAAQREAFEESFPFASVAAAIAAERKAA